MYKKRSLFFLSSVLSVAAIIMVFNSYDISNQASVSNPLANNLAGTGSINTPLELPDLQSHTNTSSDSLVYSEPKPLDDLPLTVEAIVNNTESETISTSNQLPIEKINSSDNIANASKPKQTDTVIVKHSTSLTPNIDNKPLIKSSLVKNTIKTDKNVSSNDSQIETKTVLVKKGDSLSAIFKRLSLSSSTLYKIVNSSKQAKRLTRIKPGQKFTIFFKNTSENREFTELHYSINKVDTLIVKKENNQFNTHIESKDIDIRQQIASATIENSLFLSGNKAGLNDSMIMELAQIFGWDVDFALDIRKGDSFSVLYEEKFINDKKISDGNILSAEFTNKGKTYKAVRFTDSSGHTDYYSEKGLSMRKAFLRTPVEFSRISSRFSLSRNHPLLKRKRPHKGVDYAAARGTPIKAVGDGKVIFKGRKGGYGRVIILQHGAKYSTLYAHLNSYNKKIKQGTRVSQGQVIGYIGSSGLATGPHLHYEFRVNGVHRNPLTIELPSAAPIAKKYRKEFNSTAETLISQLKLKKQETIALKDQ